MQSHQAFLTTCSSLKERPARAVIVSDSEPEDAEEYCRIKNAQSEAGKVLIQKKRLAIKQRARRLKAIAEKRFLLHTVSSRVSKILNDCPDIGETIESFV